MTTFPNPNRLNWADYHMLMAILTSNRSPDPNTQVGACIVNSQHQVLGVGYNALPRGIPSDAISWDREGDKEEDTKYPYVVHAEKNAIYNAAHRGLEGATLYVTLYPCNECAKDIIQSGIKNVIYLYDPYRDLWWREVSEWMLEKAQIKVGKHEWSKELQASGWHINL